MDAERGDEAELRLILVGKSGGGKSATGNTILDRQAFVSLLEAKTTTQRCQRWQGSWRGRKISVIDTPGLFDANDYTETVRQEILACLHLSWPGPHAFLLVTQVGRFTAEDAAAAKCVWDIFGADSAKYTLILFTCVEDLGGDSLQEYIRHTNNQRLNYLIQCCENRVCGFNNKAAGAERERQVSELMAVVQGTVARNGGRYYVNPLYLEPNVQDEHVQAFIEQNRKLSRSVVDVFRFNSLLFWFNSHGGGWAFLLKTVAVAVFSYLRSRLVAAIRYFIR